MIMKTQSTEWDINRHKVTKSESERSDEETTESNKDRKSRRARIIKRETER